MSLLLEALQRSRREQRQDDGQVPGLDAATPVSRKTGPAFPVQKYVPVLILVVVLAVGLFFGWLFLFPGGDSTRAILGGTDRVAAPATAAGPEAAAQLSLPEAEAPAATAAADAPAETLPAAKVPPAAAPGAEIVALYKNPQAARPAHDHAAVGAGLPSSVDETVSTSTAGPARRQPDTAVDSPPVDIEAMVRQAEQALQNQQLEKHSSPLLESLPQAFKDALPTLMYLRHDYRSDAPGRVTINRREAGVGESVAAGVSVVEILPDAVVLDFRGQTFRLRALSSWVNL
ncbi:MAG: hypothetical protein CME38_10470 [Haliea sp.]|nr:hypothetical protein [Haliea sp.]